MVRAAIRSILARKVRLLLTSLAVVLGVGFMAGTFVLTDTMTNAFNSLFDTAYSRIDVLVRSSNAFTAQTSSLEEREPMPASVLEQIRGVDGVKEAEGDVLGYAQIVDTKTGKIIVLHEDRLRGGMAFAIELSFRGDSFPAVDPLAIQWGGEGAFVWVARDGVAAGVPPDMVVSSLAQFPSLLEEELSGGMGA